MCVFPIMSGESSLKRGRAALCTSAATTPCLTQPERGEVLMGVGDKLSQGVFEPLAGSFRSRFYIARYFSHVLEVL